MNTGNTQATVSQSSTRGGSQSAYGKYYFLPFFIHFFLLVTRSIVANIFTSHCCIFFSFCTVDYVQLWIQHSKSKFWKMHSILSISTDIHRRDPSHSILNQFQTKLLQNAVETFVFCQTVSVEEKIFQVLMAYCHIKLFSNQDEWRLCSCALVRLETVVSL